jgi:hypothetical protein
MTLLEDGRVLVAGGARDWDCCWQAGSFVGGIEIYDPRMDTWVSGDEDLMPGAFSAAVLLQDGRVWLTGGQSGQTSDAFHSETWLITAR